MAGNLHGKERCDAVLQVAQKYAHMLTPIIPVGFFFSQKKELTTLQMDQLYYLFFHQLLGRRLSHPEIEKMLWEVHFADTFNCRYSFFEIFNKWNDSYFFANEGVFHFPTPMSDTTIETIETRTLQIMLLCWLEQTGILVDTCPLNHPCFTNLLLYLFLPDAEQVVFGYELLEKMVHLYQHSPAIVDSILAFGKIIAPHQTTQWCQQFETAAFFTIVSAAKTIQLSEINGELEQFNLHSVYSWGYICRQRVLLPLFGNDQESDFPHISHPANVVRPIDSVKSFLYGSVTFTRFKKDQDQCPICYQESLEILSFSSCQHGICLDCFSILKPKKCYTCNAMWIQSS